MATVVDDLEEAVSAARSLPQHYYTSADVFDLDLERVFGRSWLFAGVVSELPAPGDSLVWSVGPESVLIVRDEQGRLRGYHNVCRHRGCRLRADGSASSRHLVCPYHQWTYGLDGRLRGAPHMGDLDRDSLPLVPVQLRELGGLMFVCFADDPPPFATAAEVVPPQLLPHRLDQTVVAARQRYRVRANWKLLVENNRECYHCRVNHPEFCLSNFDLGVAGDLRTSRAYQEACAEQWRGWVTKGLSPREVSFTGDGWFRIARLPLRRGFATESLSGRPVAPPLGELTGDVGSLRLITLPNCWIHVNLDYAMTTRLTPARVAETTVDVTFLVRAGAVAGRDYDPAELTAVWTATSEQDWALCEQNFAGVRSRGYRPGPLSPVTEGSVQTFHRWYAGALG